MWIQQHLEMKIKLLHYLYFLLSLLSAACDHHGDGVLPKDENLMYPTWIIWEQTDNIKIQPQSVVILLLLRLDMDKQILDSHEG